MNIAEFIAVSLKRSIRYWQMLALWFLFYLLIGAGFTALPALGLLDFSRSTAIYDLAKGMPAWLLADFLLGGIAGSQSTVPSLNPVTSLSLLSLLAFLILLPILAWLPVVFLSGGTLRAYACAPRPFNLRIFLKDCWTWFGPLILLSLIRLVGLVIVAGTALLLLPLAFSLHGILGYGILSLLLLLLFWGTVFFDLSAASIVTSERRAIVPAFRLALQTIVRSKSTVPALFLLAFGLLLLFHALFRLGIFPLLPLSFWPLVLIAHQTFVALRLWTRLFRWAGGVEAVKAASVIPS